MAIDGLQLGDPIQDIGAVAGGLENPPAPSGWELLSQDLNEGAGGDYVHLIVRR